MNDIETVNMTLGRFIDAMELNGYKQATGSYIARDYTKHINTIYAACAIGQGLLNTNTTLMADDSPESIISDNGETDFGSFVIDGNDEGISIKDICNETRNAFKNKLNDVITLAKADYASKFVNYQGVRILPDVKCLDM